MCVCVCVCACVRASVYVCVCVCVRACMHVWIPHAYIRVYVALLRPCVTYAVTDTHQVLWVTFPNEWKSSHKDPILCTMAESIIV